MRWSKSDPANMAAIAIRGTFLRVHSIKLQTLTLQTMTGLNMVGTWEACGLF